MSGLKKVPALDMTSNQTALFTIQTRKKITSILNFLANRCMQITPNSHHPLELLLYQHAEMLIRAITIKFLH